jgi:hypothetical protein
VWQVEDVMGRREVRLADAPGRPDCLLLGWRCEDGTCSVRLSPRGGVVAGLAAGPADLFFANYRRDGPVRVETRDGAVLLRTTWMPRAGFGGETARVAWVDRAEGRVVQWEDRARGDRSVRVVRRLSVDPGPLVAEEGHAAPPCEGGAPAAPDLRRLAGEIGFPLLEPRYLPPGFRLLEAFPRHVRTEGDEPRARVVWLRYGDGLAVIHIVVGPLAALDAFEAGLARFRERIAAEQPDACPSLPAAQPDVAEEGLVVRRRRDRCRTVLRVDGLEGVSATVMALNELPEDEYLAVIGSLERVEPAPGD